MKNYRLTYYGLAGFNYTGFNTQKEAIEFALDQGSKGLMTPLELMKYNAKEDRYNVIGNFTKN